MIELIARLIDRGHAYESDGDVYFDVRSFAEYGALSRQDINDLRPAADSGADPRKRDPRDFALWKATKSPDEPSWPTPWGPGRPGWHLECSAMATTYLGPQFDIHGGGLDLVFPHHENEIAQSRAAERSVCELLASQRLGDDGWRKDEQVAGEFADRFASPDEGPASGASVVSDCCPLPQQPRVL